MLKNKKVMFFNPQCNSCTDRASVTTKSYTQEVKLALNYYQHTDAYLTSHSTHYWSFGRRASQPITLLLKKLVFPGVWNWSRSPPESGFWPGVSPMEETDSGSYLFHLDSSVILLQSIRLLCNLLYN